MKNTFKTTNWENPCSCCKKKMYTLGEHFKSNANKEVVTETNVGGSNIRTGTTEGPGCATAMGKDQGRSCAFNPNFPETAKQCYLDGNNPTPNQCINSCACNCACTETVDGGPEANVLKGSGGICGNQQWFLGWGGEGGGNQCQQTWSCSNYQSGSQNLPSGDFSTMGESVVAGPNSWVSTNYSTNSNATVTNSAGLSNIVDRSAIEQQHSTTFTNHKLNKHGIREII